MITLLCDHSDGLQRTVESVARDGYSNVAHVVIEHRRVDRRLDPEVDDATGLAIGASTQHSSGFADLMSEMPNAVFLELPCGEELAPGILREIMLDVETAGFRPERGRSTAPMPLTCGQASDSRLKASG